MPITSVKMLSSNFTMWVQVDERTQIAVKISGSGLKYDPETGAIVSGKVATIEYSTKSLVGTKYVTDETHKLGGLNMPADKMADYTGEKFWNSVEVVKAAFEKIAQIHDGVSFSYFSADKNVAIGSELKDTLTGSANADRIFGHAGDDRLIGANGDDQIDGGSGNDQMYGGNGNDLLIDVSGNNSFSGGAGDDAMRGGSMKDRMAGGTGRDILYGAGGTDTYTGGTGTDVFVFNSKVTSQITITDFNSVDSLVNLAARSATGAFKWFMEHADQVGNNVVYDADDVTITLQNFDIRNLTESNFASTSVVADAGLLF